MSSSSDSSTDTDDRCRALTEDGERCSRPAREDGFCYQHDESDPTVGDRAQSEQMADGNNDSHDSAESGQSGDDERVENEQATDGDDEGSHDDGADSDRSGSVGSDIMSVRDTVLNVGHDLIGSEIDRIVEITRDGSGDGWRAMVEVIERPAVPDTQDILGKYEIELGSDGSVEGYRRVDRYRRVDTDQDEPPG